MAHFIAPQGVADIVLFTDVDLKNLKSNLLKRAGQGTHYVQQHSMKEDAIRFQSLLGR